MKCFPNGSTQLFRNEGETRMKSILRKSIAVLLIISIVNTVAPLAGFRELLMLASAEVQANQNPAADYSWALEEAEGKTSVTGGMELGDWTYVPVGDGTMAVVTGHADHGESALEVPAVIDQRDVIGLAHDALAGHNMLDYLTIPGNVMAIDSNAIPRGITVKSYNGSYTQQWAARKGYAFINLSQFEFLPGVVDFEGISDDRFHRVSQEEMQLHTLEASRLSVGTYFFLLDHKNPYQVSYYHATAISEPNDEGFVTVTCVTPTIEEIMYHVSLRNEDMHWDLSTLRVEEGVEMTVGQQTVTSSGFLEWGSSETKSFEPSVSFEIDLKDKGKITFSGKYSNNVKTSVEGGVFKETEVEVKDTKEWSGSIGWSKKYKKGSTGPDLDSGYEPQKGVHLSELNEMRKKMVACDDYDTKSIKENSMSIKKTLGACVLFSFAGIVTIDLEIAFKGSITGSFEVSFSSKSVTTYKYKGGELVSKDMKDLGKTITGEVKVSLKAGFEVTLKVYVFIIPLIGVSVFVGVKADASISEKFTIADSDSAVQVFNLNMLDCIEVEVKLVLGVTVSALPIRDIFSITLWDKEWYFTIIDAHIHFLPHELVKDGPDGYSWHWGGPKDMIHLADDCPYENSKITFECVYPDGSTKTAGVIGDLEQGTEVGLSEFPNLTGKSIIKGHRLDGWYLSPNTDNIVINWRNLFQAFGQNNYNWGGFTKVTDKVTAYKDLTVYGRLIPVQTVHVAYKTRGSSELTYKEAQLDRDEKFTVTSSGLTALGQSDSVTFDSNIDSVGWYIVKNFHSFEPVEEINAGEEQTVEDKDIYILGLSSDDVLASFYCSDNEGTVLTSFARIGGTITAPDHSGLQLIHYQFDGWKNKERLITFPVTTYADHWTDAAGVTGSYGTSNGSNQKIITFVGKWSYDENQSVTADDVVQILGSSLSSSALSATQISDEQYYKRSITNADKKEASITGLNTNISSAGNAPYYLIIPNTVIINGESYKVVKIADSAFANNTDIKAVRFAQNSNVSTIGSNAFAGCTSLLQADLSQCKLTSLSTELFKGCTKLKCVLLNSRVKSIGESCFYNCKVISSAKLNAEIGETAFMHCSGITSLTMGKGVEKIGNYAFAYCTGLTTVEVPDSVLTLGNSFLSFCTNVETLKINGSPNRLTFDMLNIGEGSKLKKLTLAAGITELGDSALTNGGAYFNYLTELNLPSTLEKFGVNCFKGIKVKKLTISSASTLTKISESAFEGLTTLEELTILGGEIGEKAFKDCTSLKTIHLGAQVSKIGPKAFEGCGSLQNLDMSQCVSLTEVGDEAFKNCTSLAKIVFPNCIETYGNHILAGCTKLKEITVGCSDGYLGASSDNSPFYIGSGSILEKITLNDSIQTVGKGLFANSTTTKDSDLQAASGFASLNEIRLSHNQTGIGDYAFYRAGAGSINWPDGISSIGKYAFAGSKIVHLELSGDNLVIGEYAFANMPSLTDLTIKDGVYKLDNYSFSGCTKLNTVDMADCDTVKLIGSRVFNNCSGITSLAFADSISEYGDKVIAGCSSLSSLTIGYSGGYLAAKNSSASPFYIGETNSLRSLKINSGITSIGDYLFANGTTTSSAGSGFTHLNSLSLPSTLYSIGNYAFYKAGTCGSLPSSLGSIGNYAFAYSGGASKLTLKGSGLSIGDYAFAGAYVKELIIADGVSSIGDGAFSGCGSMVSGDMSEASSLYSVGSKAFQNCGNLSALTFPNGMSSYGAEVISGCTSLKNLTIGCDGGTLSAVGGVSPFYIGASNSLETLIISEGVAGIDSGIFANSRLTSNASSGSGFVHLTTLQLPATLESIGSYAFFKAGMATLRIPSSLHTMGDYAFSQTGMKVLTLYGNDLAIGNYAFANNDSLLNVSIEEGVSSLGVGAFSNNAVLRKVNMSACDTMKTISNQAFISCPMLKVLIFADSITSYGDRLIEGDAALEDLYVGYAGGMLEAAGGTSCSPFYIGETNSLKRLTIGRGITGVASCMFSNYTDTLITNGTYGTGFPGLENINLPESLLTIGEYAFYRSGSYVLNLPAHIQSIGSHAFAYATKITELVLSGDQLDIGIYAFANLPQLQSVTVLDGVRSIGNYAFDNTPTLLTADMSACTTLTTVNGYLFRNCSSLKSLSLPASVTYYGDEIIVGCTALEDLTVGFNGVITSSKGTSFSPFYVGRTSALKHIVIVEGTTGVGDCIFANYTKTLPTSAGSSYGFTNLESITLPSTLKTIGSYAFYKAGTYELNLPESLEEIGDYAFGYIDKLTDLTLKGNHLNVGSYAFSHAVELLRVRVENATETIGSYAFSNCPKLLSVDMGGCNTLTTIENYAFQSCKALKSIVFADSMTTYGDKLIYADTALESIKVGAAGELKQGSGTWSPFYISSKAAVKELIIGETVTSIVDCLFNNYSSTSATYGNRGYGYKNLEKLVLPSGIESIGTYTFFNAGASTDLTVYTKQYNGTVAAFASADGHTYVYDSYPDFTLTCVNPVTEESFTCNVSWGNTVVPISWTGSNLSVTAADIAAWQDILTAPSTAHYVFEGWYLDEECTVPLLQNSISIGGVTVYAHMLRECTVSLMLDDGHGNFRPYQTVNAVEGDSISLSAGVLEGRTFDAWYKNPECTEKWIAYSDTMPAEDLTLYGAFIPMQTANFVIAKESVLYMRGSDIYDAFTDYTSFEVERGATITTPAEPDIEGYTFSGWFIDENFVKEWEYRNIGNTDITIYGRLRRKTAGGVYTAVSGGYELTRYALEEDESTEVYLPARYNGQPVVSIADYAFNETKVTVLHLPENLVSVGEHAFSGAEQLRALRISGNNTHYSTLNGMLLDKNGTVLYKCPTMAATGTIRIPDGIEEIRPYAFEDAVHLTEISLPDSVTAVGQHAFKGCENLIKFSAYGLTSIGSGALPINSLLKVEGPVGGGALRNYCLSAGNDASGTFSSETIVYSGIPYNMHYVNLYLDGELRARMGVESGVLLDSDLQYAEVDGNTITSGWFRNSDLTENWNFATDVMPMEDITLYSTTMSIYSWTASADGSGIVLTGYYGKGGSVALPSMIDGLPVTQIADGFLATANGAVQAISIGSSVTVIGETAFNAPSAYPFGGRILCDADSYAYQWAAAHGYIGTNRTYSLTFETNGGALIEAREAAANASIRLRDPVRTNSTFAGWFTDADFEEPAATDENNLFVMPAYDVILYAKWNEEMPVYDFEWAEQNDGITIIRYTAEEPTVEIPATINGVSVVRIGEAAFQGNQTLSAIELPATVRYIGDEAFADTAIISADLGGTVSIGERAFSNCGLLISVQMNQVRVIGEYAFSGCALLNDPALSDTLMTISANAFEECLNLKQITIPDNVTAVETGAFNNCARLKNVTIGSGCSEISAAAFSGCSALETITVSSGNNYYKSNSGVLFSKNNTKLICYPSGNTTATYTIPSGVTSIAESAFESSVNLKKIVMNAGLTVIDTAAFRNCTALTEADFTAASGLTTIGDSAFAGCTKLTEAVLPGSVTRLGAAAFLGCMSMTGLTIGDQITEIGISALPENNEDFVVYCHYNSAAWNYAVQNEVAHSDPSRIEATAAVISGETQIMTRGSTQQLTLAIEPANASETNVVWYADSDILLVTDGFVSALSSGTATVYAVLENGVKATYEIEVAVPVLSISDEQTEYELGVGHDITLAPVLLPAAAIERALVWTSGNPDIAAVDENGTVTGVNQGQTTITAVTESGLSLTYDFTVILRLDGIQLSATDICLIQGQNVEFGNIRTIPAQANTGEFTFSVDADDVLSVDAAGHIHAIAAGEAVITVGVPQNDEITVNCHVTVVDSMSKLQLPGALSEIEEEAFAGITAEALVIPDGAVSIGRRAFADNSVLKQVVLPASLTTISNDAFGDAAMTIICPANSAAERFATDHGYSYMSFGD